MCYIDGFSYPGRSVSPILPCPQFHPFCNLLPATKILNSHHSAGPRVDGRLCRQSLPSIEGCGCLSPRKSRNPGRPVSGSSRFSCVSRGTMSSCSAQPSGVSSYGTHWQQTSQVGSRGCIISSCRFERCYYHRFTLPFCDIRDLGCLEHSE